MKRQMSKALEQKICDALGLDSRMVRGVRINLEADQVATMDVTMFVDAEKNEELVRVINEFYLVPKEEA
jgi:hypothetical protein